MDNREILRRARVRNIKRGAAGLGIGVLLLVISIVDLVVADTLILWGFIIGGGLALAGLAVIFLGSADKTDVTEKRKKAEEYRMRGDTAKADALDKEADELEAALNAQNK
jgi:hypothetical protein